MGTAVQICSFARGYPVVQILVVEDCSAQAELSWPLCGSSIFHKVKVNLFTSGLSIHFYSIDSKYLFLLNLLFESVTKQRLKELLPLKAHPGLRTCVEPGGGVALHGLFQGRWPVREESAQG